MIREENIARIGVYDQGGNIWIPGDGIDLGPRKTASSDLIGRIKM